MARGAARGRRQGHSSPGLRALLLASLLTGACFARDCSCDQDQTRPGCRTFEPELPLPSPPACGNGVVLSDGFDRSDAGWSNSIEATPGFSAEVAFGAPGGNPGGYRRMTHILGGRGLIVVSHVFDREYAPQNQGSIRSIRYSEDRRQFDPPFAGAAVGSGFVVEQGGRRLLLPLAEFGETSWQRLEATFSPADLPGINLSGLTGAPIRFGYYRANSDSTATVRHGIDNWRVEICR